MRLDYFMLLCEATVHAKRPAPFPVLVSLVFTVGLLCLHSLCIAIHCLAQAGDCGAISCNLFLALGDSALHVLDLTLKQDALYIFTRHKSSSPLVSLFQFVCRTAR